MLITLVALASLTPAPVETPVVLHGRLQAKGNQIVDKAGKPVSLAGNSFFWSQWMPQYYTAGVVDWLKEDWKSGVVRVAVGISRDGYLGNPDVETQRAITVADAAVKNGLYVIIDWHDHNAHKNEEAATKFFETMAMKYGNQPHVIYELWNEPVNVSWKDDVKPYAVRVIKAIRKIDPDNLILVGSPHWSQDVQEPAADPIQDVNVAYTLHFYAGTHKKWLRDRADEALAKGVPLFVSEWGTCDASGNGGFDPGSTKEWMDWMKAKGISHCNWSVADKVETASILNPGASVTGNWKESDLTESGKLVRGIIRGWSD